MGRWVGCQCGGAALSRRVGEQHGDEERRVHSGLRLLERDIGQPPATQNQKHAFLQKTEQQEDRDERKCGVWMGCCIQTQTVVCRIG